MSRKQELDAIYDRLCWILNGAMEGKIDPTDFWSICSPESLRCFINAVSETWGIREAGEDRLQYVGFIANWSDLEKVVEIIYEGGGRINKPMDSKKGK